MKHILVVYLSPCSTRKAFLQLGVRLLVTLPFLSYELFVILASRNPNQAAERCLLARVGLRADES